MDPFTTCALFDVPAEERLRAVQTLVTETVEALEAALTVFRKTPVECDDTGRPQWRQAGWPPYNDVIAEGMADALRKAATLAEHLGRADEATWTRDQIAACDEQG